MVRTISPEITIDTASKPSASTMLWVASRILPTKNGLTYPDRLPTELIHAMPAAAAVPERMAGGSDQKHTIPERAPAVATVSVAISAQPPIWGRALSANAAPLIRHGAATCHRRSPVRSECPPTTTIAMAAVTHGITEMKPISNVSVVIRSLMICGSQNTNP